MTHFFLDASAMVKRYLPEAGRPPVHLLFDTVQPKRLHCLWIGVLETLSVIVRARNEARVSGDAAESAIRSFYWEVVCGSLHRMHPPEQTLLNAADLIERHNINSTDAVLLQTALDLHATLRPTRDSLVLVASDHRLVRAAGREALPTFDPETGSLPSLRRLAQAP